MQETLLRTIQRTLIERTCHPERSEGPASRPHPHKFVISTEVERPAVLRSRTPRAICLALLLTTTAQTQQPWQHLQNPTAAEVQSVWTTPPPEYGPEPYYGLNGPVDQTVIARDLDAMQSLGYTAVTAQAGYNMREPYLSEPYFKLFGTLVSEAKKRNMRVWIVDDAGYPSGFAGGKFTTEHPELRMQALVIAERIPATAGDLVAHPVKPETVAVTALNADDGKTIAVPFPNNTINWKTPPGHWTILIVEHQFSTSPTRSDTNPKRTKDASQSLEDYLDPLATAQYLEFTHAQYKKYLGDEFGKTIMGFRGDEPDYSIRGLPWTPKFFDRFQALKGYDIRPYVATFLANPKTPLNDPQRRAKADYYDVFSQLFSDGFFKPQGEWCAANHLEYQVHLNHEEMEVELAHSEGDFFRAMRGVEIPGIDSIWHQIFPDTISDFPRLAASAAHLYGKPRAFTESFAAYRPEPTITEARYVLNEQFVRGINLVETMYYPSSANPKGTRSPYMRDPAYPALLTYTRRMSYLLSMGRPAAEVALFLPTSSLWLNDDASDTAFVATEQLLSEHQIDFDIVSEDALARDLKPTRTGLESASGNTYRTIILPSPAVLSQAALDRLQAFAKTGGKVLFLGRTPTLISNRTILNARRAKPSDFKWAAVETSAQLPPTPTPPAQPPTSPPGPQIVPPAILSAVIKAVGTPDVTLDAPDSALKIMKRRLKDSDVYLLFTPNTRTITFHNDGQMIEVWDPQTATVSGQISTRDEGKLSIHLNLKPYETAVFLIR